MERVKADKSERYYYADELNYLYKKNRQQNQSIYFVCKNRNCPSRLILRLGVITKRTNHVHQPEGSTIEDLRFREALNHRARTETTELSVIFREVQLLHPNAALRLESGYNTVKNVMSKCRMETMPPNPNTLQEAHEFLMEPRYQRYSVELGPEARPFYHTLVNGAEGESLIFVSQTVLGATRDNPGQLHLCMDATFKVLPRAGNAYQLFMIHYFYEDMVFPLMYCLMQRRTTDAYVAVLNELVRILPGGAIVRSVMSDYEASLRRAIRQVLPDCRLRGCWFHYAKAVYLKARQMGLTQQAQQVAAVRMAMAIPLLPQNQVLQGMEHIFQILGNDAFEHYMRRQWTNANVSVHNADFRTNNHVESMHGHLLQFIGRAHPPFWMFIGYLQKVEHFKGVDLARLRNGIQLRRQPRPRYRANNRRIDAAQARLARDNNVAQFLRTTSHAVIGLQRNIDPPEDNEELLNNYDVEEDGNGLIPNDLRHNMVNPIIEDEPEPNGGNIMALDNFLIDNPDNENDDIDDENDLAGELVDPGPVHEPEIEIEELVDQVPVHEPEFVEIGDVNEELLNNDDIPDAIPVIDLNLNNECVVCMERRKTHAPVPCGHYCLCGICAVRMQHCPYCRAPIQMIIRIYQ